MRTTAEAANGRWREILVSLGMDRSYLTGNHGPCPLCGGGKDRWRFDDLEGRGTYYCSHCGPGDGLKLATHWTGEEFKIVAKRIDEICGNLPDRPVQQPTKKQDPAIRLRKIHSETCFVQAGDPVAKYLFNRGFDISEDGGHIVSCIRTHKALGYYEKNEQNRAVKIGDYPAMITMFSDVNGQPCTYHVTYLTSEGRKAPVADVRKTLTPVSVMDGGAVLLGGNSQDEILGICEGIETALAVYKLFGVKCWPTLNELLLQRFAARPGVKEYRVYGDNDANFTGQRAAYILGWNLKKAGLNASVHIPPKPGTDWNDVWMDTLRKREAKCA